MFKYTRLKSCGATTVVCWGPVAKLKALGKRSYRIKCGRGSVVEHHLAKVRVAGSNPVVRSMFDRQI